jgi:hypothetical protein
MTQIPPESRKVRLVIALELDDWAIETTVYSSLTSVIDTA